MNSKILNKNIKFTFVFSLIIIVISIFISIGYATVSYNIWFNTMVHFDVPPIGITSVTCTGQSGMTCSGTISAANKIGATGTCGPIGYHTYTITVKNNSTVDKQITNVTWGGASIIVYQNNTPLNQRIKSGESKTFTILIDQTGSSYGGAWTFTFANYTITKMVDYAGADNYLGCSNIARTNIESLYFQTNTTAPSGTVQTCNVDVGGAGKIKAFATDTNNNGKYEVTIGSVDGEVFAGQSTHIAQSLSNLTTVNFANFNTKYTTSMEKMFYGCTSLVNISNWNLDTSNVTTMKCMFENMSARNSGLNVSMFDTSKVTDMSYMFKGMTNLPSVNVRNFNMSKVTNSDQMFYNCTNLKTIYAGNVTWSLASGGTSSNMFYGCTSVKGGNGTTYDSTKVDKTYARIDKSGQKGYFTQ